MVLIYLIKIQVRHVVKFRLRCSWIVVVLIYLIKMQIRHVVKLDSDVHG